MSAPSLLHSQLKTKFTGTYVSSHGVTVEQYRGIKYGVVPRRFELAQAVEVSDSERAVDATKFGPRCPQNPVDVRHLLRIPEDFEIGDEPEDELECLNLDITCPTEPLSQTKPMPVLVWIHGGSQVVTFCSAASKICDPSRIVADSVTLKRPIIVVSLNYRLNIFAFGDGKERNLALKDQRLGIEWVRKYIKGFGGDPDNITLAGESAGAIFVHAHLITGPQVKRAVLASGSLYLSSPLPVARGNALLQNLEQKVQAREQKTLRDCSAKALLEALNETGLQTMWLQEDEELDNWDSKREKVEELMIGDVEYESVIWRNGIEKFTAQEIVSAFETTNPESGRRLRKLYHIVPDRDTASKLGALDFVNDTRYTLPIDIIADRLTSTKTNDHNNESIKPVQVFKYLIDQPNPWQSSSRAHHAVDLLFLFGNFDFLSPEHYNPSAEAVSRETRSRWIRFVNGDQPWNPERRFAYGPFGECREIDEHQYAARRRVAHLKVLREAGINVYIPIVFALTAGRISLLN